MNQFSVQEFVVQSKKVLLGDETLGGEFSQALFEVIEIFERLASSHSQVDDEVVRFIDTIEKYKAKSQEESLGVQASLNFLTSMPVMSKLKWTPQKSPIDVISDACEELRQWIDPSLFNSQYGSYEFTPDQFRSPTPPASNTPSRTSPLSPTTVDDSDSDNPPPVSDKSCLGNVAANNMKEFPILHVGVMSEFRMSLLPAVVQAQLPLEDWNSFDGMMLLLVSAALFNGNGVACLEFLELGGSKLTRARSAITLYQNMTHGKIVDERNTLQPLVKFFLMDLFHLYRTMYPNSNQLDPMDVTDVNEIDIGVIFPRSPTNLYEKFLIAGKGDLDTGTEEQLVIAQVKRRLGGGECSAEKDQFFINLVAALQSQICGPVLVRPNDNKEDSEEVTIGASLNASPDATAATVGMLTDLFSMLIGYGCYENGKFKFGMNGYNASTIMPPKDYVLHVLFLHCLPPHLLLNVKKYLQEYYSKMPNLSNMTHSARSPRSAPSTTNNKNSHDLLSYCLANYKTGSNDAESDVDVNYDSNLYYGDGELFGHDDGVAVVSDPDDDDKRNGLVYAIRDSERSSEAYFSSVADDNCNCTCNR